MVPRSIPVSRKGMMVTPTLRLSIKRQRVFFIQTHISYCNSLKPMASSPLSVTSFKLIFSTGWLIIILDHVLLLRLFGLDWSVALVDAAINDGLLILSCLLVTMMLRYYLPQREKYFHLVSWCILITVIIVLLTKVILK